MTREEILMAFVKDLFAEMGWPDGGDLDAIAFQEICVKHGLLIEVKRFKPCSEVEGDGDNEWKDGVKCFQKAEWIIENKEEEQPFKTISPENIAKGKDYVARLLESFEKGKII